jgi:hypothetical protein
VGSSAAGTIGPNTRALAEAILAEATLRRLPAHAVVCRSVAPPAPAHAVVR